MRIGVLTIGNTDSEIIAWIKEHLTRAFPDATSIVVNEKIQLREDSFDEKRKQYKSHMILSEVQSFAFRKPYLSRILGVVDADIFVPKIKLCVQRSRVSRKSSFNILVAAQTGILRQQNQHTPFFEENA